MHTGRCLGAGDDGAGSSGSGSENKSSSDAEQVAENAMRVVRIVRRREREEYDGCAFITAPSWQDHQLLILAIRAAAGSDFAVHPHTSRGFYKI